MKLLAIFTILMITLNLVAAAAIEAWNDDKDSAWEAPERDGRIKKSLVLSLTGK